MQLPFLITKASNEKLVGNTVTKPAFHIKKNNNNTVNFVFFFFAML